MNKKKQWINIDNISLALWIIAAIIAFIFNKYYVAFYCWIAVIIINITFYLYEYKIPNRNKKIQQLDSLCNLRKHLRYATELLVLTYVFSCFWMDDRSLIDNPFLFVLGLLSIISILSLIACNFVICYCKKKQKTKQNSC